MKEPPPRRRRSLSDSERVLWGEVVRDVVPLRPQRKKDAEAVERPEPGEDVESQSAQPQKRTRPPKLGGAPAPPTPPPLAPLGRRLRQRIARGSHAIGGRIDLHGLTQREAHDALLGFLRTAQGRGAGIVLVITGKGGSDGERGVLRRQVPHWLRLPAFRELIVGFEPAHATHGGEGALYVQMRKARG